jgi:Protein of unknown function (DUF3619)
MTDNINQHLNKQQLNQEDIVDTDLQGKQIASLLDAHAKRLSMRTLKQLEDGRARAIKVHAQQLSGNKVNKDGTLSAVFGWAEYHRVASTGLILSAIIFGMVLIQTLGQKEVSDAFLLGADLPPEAFVDRGFEPSLNNGKLKL